MSFWRGRRIWNVSCKNWYFIDFEGFRLQMYGKVRPKNFCRAYVKVFILRKKTHESTQMVPEYPQKIFYRLLALCMDFQESSWGGEISLEHRRAVCLFHPPSFGFVGPNSRTSVFYICVSVPLSEVWHWSCLWTYTLNFITTFCVFLCFRTGRGA